VWVLAFSPIFHMKQPDTGVDDNSESSNTLRVCVESVVDRNVSQGAGLGGGSENLPMDLAASIS
jgi:hypothetical protein